MQIRPTIAYMISCTDSKTVRKLLFNYGYTLLRCMLTYRKIKQKLYMIQHYTTNMHIDHVKFGWENTDCHCQALSYKIVTKNSAFGLQAALYSHQPEK